MGEKFTDPSFVAELDGARFLGDSAWMAAEDLVDVTGPVPTFTPKTLTAEWVEKRVRESTLDARLGATGYCTDGRSMDGKPTTPIGPVVAVETDENRVWVQKRFIDPLRGCQLKRGQAKDAAIAAYRDNKMVALVMPLGPGATIKEDG